LGFAPQGQFQQVFLDARLDGLAQLGLDFEETVGRAQSLDALVGPFVVVVLNPQFDPFAGALKVLELGPREELLPDAFPEALDLAQGHGMVWTAFEVRHPVLGQFGLESALSPPGGVLAAIVGEHLFGRLIFADGDPVHFDDRLSCVAAEQVRSHDEARIIVHEGN